MGKSWPKELAVPGNQNEQGWPRNALWHRAEKEDVYVCAAGDAEGWGAAPSGSWPLCSLNGTLMKHLLCFERAQIWQGPTEVPGELPGTFLPQALCTCFFLCLQCSPTDIQITSFLNFVGASVTCQLLHGAFPDRPIQNGSDSSPSLPTEAPILIFPGLPLIAPELRAKVKLVVRKTMPTPCLLPPPFPSRHLKELHTYI